MKRLPPDPAYAVDDVVLELARRFQYPDADTIGPAVMPGGGGGAPTVVVAASDATDLSKSKADYLCTGVADHSQIMEAVSIVAAFGGRVLLTEGNFNVDTNQINLEDTSGIFNGITLEGMGLQTTRLVTTNTSGAVVAAADFSHIKGMSFIGSSTEAAIGGTQFNIGIGTGGERVFIDEVYFQGFDVAVYLSGNYWVINRCRLPTSNLYFVQDNDDYTGTTIVNNQWEGGHVDMGNGIDWLVAANKTAASIVANATGGFAIVGNAWETGTSTLNDAQIEIMTSATGFVIASNQMPEPGNDGIKITGGVDGIIANNQFGVSVHGVYLINSSEIVVAANNLADSDEHTVLLDGCDNCTVQANTVTNAGQATTNTYDAINITGDDNLIQGNKIVPATVSPLTRYGINIASGSNNAVYANYLGDSSDYGTADSIDSGTATQTTPAAGAIGGQFAY